jgi:hypothetical protein
MGYRAYEEGTTVNYGLTVLLIVLTTVIWAARATTSVTEMAVIRGQLEIIRNGKFEVIDLASVYTPVAVEGKPGHRGWRVLIERHDQPLMVIDASMVDPHRFTAVLYRVRPDLRPGATPAQWSSSDACRCGRPRRLRRQTRSCAPTAGCRCRR